MVLEFNESSVPGSQKFVPTLEKLSRHVLEQMNVHPDTVVSLSFVELQQMEELHLEWMGLTGPTDVLSFPMDELVPGTKENPTPAGLLGDIVLNLDVAAEQAESADHPIQTELKILFTHGMLHLLGFDHNSPLEEAEMFGLQREIIESFNKSEANL